MLREVRDNILLETQYDSLLMNGFNTIYYSFSPYVADLENELFRDTVRTFITPMITALSIMTMADDSEIDVLFFGISTLGIIVGMYVVTPVVLIRHTWKKKN